MPQSPSRRVHFSHCLPPDYRIVDAVICALWNSDDTLRLFGPVLETLSLTRLSRLRTFIFVKAHPESRVMVVTALPHLAENQKWRRLLLPAVFNQVHVRRMKSLFLGSSFSGQLLSEKLFVEYMNAAICYDHLSSSICRRPRSCVVPLV